MDDSYTDRLLLLGENSQARKVYMHMPPSESAVQELHPSEVPLLLRQARHPKIYVTAHRLLESTASFIVIAPYSRTLD